MERNPSLFSILITAILIAAAAAINHALSPTEAYWQKMVPNTPMPPAIRNLVNPEVNDEKAGTDVGVGKGGVHVNAGKGGTAVDVGKDGVHVNAGAGKPKGGTTVNVGKGGVNVNTGKGKPGGTTVGVGRKGVGVNAGNGNTHVDVGKGGVNVNTGHKGKPVVLSVKPGRGWFGIYHDGTAADHELHYDPTVALFFLEKDLHPGTKMNLLFSATKAPLNGPPINSKKLPEILSEFSIEPQSLEAEAIRETFNICTKPAAKGEEDKFCPTTVESMIDFVVSKLGNHVEALTTTGETDAPLQEYTVASGVEKVKGPRSVSCHTRTFVYPVYYCHETPATDAYVVPLVGADGSKVEAVAVCHKDTSAWNPRHLAFQVVKVKPGTVPICHFIPQDHIVWAQN